ncbi:hypothetical protein OHT76_05770 [Streptomyces sp. NBC_00287]|uniref:hypothetical protein n=1 Tax=Streptomyces sp. NBC_00287 TaxID=2975702 RepID=UPI002E27B161|nr:hypothetical protein [Streptomyces sp. NBC_00287]
MNHPEHALEVLHTRVKGQNVWTLITEGALAKVRADRISTVVLESFPVNRREVAAHVENVMSALEHHSSRRTVTPGGADWLHVHHVPVRRLVTQLVRRLLVLSAWEPFARSPGPLALSPNEGLIGIREIGSREYRSYTVTWSGVAYALGASAPHNPIHSLRLRQLSPRSPQGNALTGQPVSLVPPTDVVALSWSSRHWRTILPVLEALGREGHRSMLVDLATDRADRCTAPMPKGTALLSAPSALFTASGPVPVTDVDTDGPAIQVGVHALQLRRLERLAGGLLEVSGGCTQPSWHATLLIERWLDEVLDAVRPHTVVGSNDTSPLGALAVHAAERRGITSVYVQHGAWVEEAVARPALHSRHIVVMGERDAERAEDWSRHPDTEIHVLGQPRFDALAHVDRAEHRRRLQELLSTPFILVWACQPYGPGRLKAQADLLLEGIRRTSGNWGLAIAPHPAQRVDVFDDVLQRDTEGPVAVVDPRVGARGCVAGADGVASVSSTCGIEAVLLNVPVLEIAVHGEPTLGLAAHGLANRCGTADDIASALTAVSTVRPSRPPSATDAVCRWRGSSARDIAQMIVNEAQVHHEAHGKGGLVR